MLAVSVGRVCSRTNLLRLYAIHDYHILGNTGELHIATVDSVLHELVRVPLGDNSDFSSQRVNHHALILSNAVFDLSCFLVPAQRFGTDKFCSWFAFFLLRKHKFQVDLIGRIIFDKYTIIGAFPEKIIEILACISAWLSTTVPDGSYPIPNGSCLWQVRE